MDKIKLFYKTKDIKHLEDIDNKYIKIFKKYIPKIYKKYSKNKNWTKQKICDILIKHYDINIDIYNEENSLDNDVFNKILNIYGKKIKLKHNNDITVNGFSLDVIKSALQKCIRRNNIYSVNCGVEWSLLRCGESDKKGGQQSVITNLRNRLRIIYLEDINIADIEIWKKLDKYTDNININKTKNKKCSKINPNGIELEYNMIKSISLMSQTYHTRICSYLNSFWKLKGKTFFIKYIENFPNVRIILDSIEENKNKTDEENFINSIKEKDPICFYYSKMISENKLFDILYKYYPENKEYIDLSKKWYNEIDNTEAWLSYYIPILIICFEVNIKKMDYIEYEEKWKNIVNNCIKKEPIIMENYIYDIHTKIGNIRGLTKTNYEGIKLFVDEGAYVENEYKPKLYNKKYNNDFYEEIQSFYKFTKILSVSDYEKAKIYIRKKKIAVVGSRTFTDYELMKKELDKYSISEIISGGAIGADKLSEKYSDEKDIDMTIYEPDWKKYGKSAGIIRNKDIVNNSDMVIAFWDRKSKGTKNSIDYANKIGKPLKIIYTKQDGVIQIISEQDIFKYITRAQITCGLSKVDSYFAKLKQNHEDFKKDEIVFVKGPYKTNILYNIFVLFNQIREKMEIPFIKVSEMKLKVTKDVVNYMGENDIIDRHKSNIRFKVDDNKEYTFLIFENLCEEDIPTKIYTGQTSGKWEDCNVKVVDWKLATKCRQFSYKDLEDISYMYQYVITLYFRYLFGVGDTADRNFVIKDNILYGVDEEVINEETNFGKLTKNFKYIRENWSKIEDKIINKLNYIESILVEIEPMIKKLGKYEIFMGKFEGIKKNPISIFL